MAKSRIWPSSPHRLINVMAYGRSGTKYTSAYFQYMGLNVTHEYVGKDGICGFMFAWNKEHDCRLLMSRNQYHQRVDYEFKYNIHLLRDPWLILNSNMSGSKGFSSITEGVLTLDGESRLEKEMQSMTQWYRIINSQSLDLTVKVEYLPFVLPVWMTRQGISYKCVGDPPSRLVNSTMKRPYTPSGLDWTELSSVRPDILEDFKTYVADAGYDPHALDPVL